MIIMTTMTDMIAITLIKFLLEHSVTLFGQLEWHLACEKPAA